MGRKSMKCVGGKERCQQEMPLLTCVSYLGVSQALPPPAPSAFIYLFFLSFFTSRGPAGAGSPFPIFTNERLKLRSVK